MPDTPNRTFPHEKLELTLRAHQALDEVGLKTLGDILNKTERELIRLLGPDVYAEIFNDILTPNRFTLRQESPPANENSPDKK